MVSSLSVASAVRNDFRLLISCGDILTLFLNGFRISTPRLSANSDWIGNMGGEVGKEAGGTIGEDVGSHFFGSVGGEVGSVGALAMTGGSGLFVSSVIVGCSAGEGGFVRGAK